MASRKLSGIHTIIIAVFLCIHLVESKVTSQHRPFWTKLHWSDSFSLEVNVDLIPYHRILPSDQAFQLQANQKEFGAKLDVSVNMPTASYFLGFGQSGYLQRSETFDLRKQLVFRTQTVLGADTMKTWSSGAQTAAKSLDLGYLTAEIAFEQTVMPLECRNYVPSAYVTLRINSSTDPLFNWTVLSHPSAKVFENNDTAVYSVTIGLMSYGRELVDLLCVVVKPNATADYLYGAFVDFTTTSPAFSSATMASGHFITASRSAVVSRRGNSNIHVGALRASLAEKFVFGDLTDSKLCDGGLGICLPSSGPLPVYGVTSYDPKQLQILRTNSPGKATIAINTNNNAHVNWVNNVLGIRESDLIQLQLQSTNPVNWTYDPNSAFGTFMSTITATNTGVQDVSAAITTTSDLELLLGQKIMENHAIKLLYDAQVGVTIVWTAAVDPGPSGFQAALLFFIIILLLRRLDKTDKLTLHSFVAPRGNRLSLVLGFCTPQFYNRNGLHEKRYRISKVDLMVDFGLLVLFFAALITSLARQTLVGVNVNSLSPANLQSQANVSTTGVLGVQIVFYVAMGVYALFSLLTQLSTLMNAYEFDKNGHAELEAQNPELVLANQRKSIPQAADRTLLWTLWHWCRQLSYVSELTNVKLWPAMQSLLDTNEAPSSGGNKPTQSDGGHGKRASDYLVRSLFHGSQGYMLAFFASVLLLDWNLANSFTGACIAVLFGVIIFYMTYHLLECVVILISSTYAGLKFSILLLGYVLFLLTWIVLFLVFGNIDIILPLVYTFGLGNYTQSVLVSIVWAFWSFGLVCLLLLQHWHCLKLFRHFQKLCLKNKQL